MSKNSTEKNVIHFNNNTLLPRTVIQNLYINHEYNKVRIKTYFSGIDTNNSLISVSNLNILNSTCIVGSGFFFDANANNIFSDQYDYMDFYFSEPQRCDGISFQLNGTGNVSCTVNIEIIFILE